jgi:aspartyl/glutamyl-tRNA(Asn/Gln) amidotransferase C subunit
MIKNMDNKRKNKIPREEIQFVANSLFFNLNEKEIYLIEHQSENLLDELDRLEHFDVSNVKPTNFPVDQSFSTLREDVVQTSQSDEIISNASEKKNKFVVVK